MLTHKREVPAAVKLLRQLHLPDRVRVILYIPRRSRDPKGVYPVNKLRNIAIVNTVTTHFLVMDMDMWPARGRFSPSLPQPRSSARFICCRCDYATSGTPPSWCPRSSWRKSPFSRAATIFSPVRSRAFAALCVRRRSEKAFPANKTQLVACLDQGRCLTHKHRTQTHVGQGRVVS